MRPFRARARWVKEGEKNTKYFFALEKRNYGLKTMKRLQTDHGIVTEQNEILKEQEKFYKTLYTANEDIVFNIQNTSQVRITGRTEMPDGRTHH